MKRTVIKIIIALVIVAILAGAGVVLYFRYNSGPIVGRVKYGAYYSLTEMRDTDQFAGATMSSASYFHIDTDGKTGKFYLEGLTATDSPVPFIITNYKETNRKTTFDIEYLIGNGNDTHIEHLTATSVGNRITIQADQSHAVRIIKQKKQGDTDSLEYPVDILIFECKEDA